jgi:phosphate acetyltransferase
MNECTPGAGRPQGTYVASGEGRSGKSLIVLGLVDLLSRCGARVGFFRPLVRSRDQQDSIIHLIASRYPTRVPYEAMFGCTYDDARQLFAAGKGEQVIDLIVAKYKPLEQEHDFVVCCGFDFTGVGIPIEFDLNVRIANELGCLLIPVVQGFGKTPSQVEDAGFALYQTLQQQKSAVLAVVANRVAPEIQGEVTERLRRAMPAEVLVVVIAEYPLLNKPTVGEVGRKLGARFVTGEAGCYQRVVKNYKVAAMELPNFLDHLEDGSLIITPGDRSDIILGSLIAERSGNFPQLAGLLLTGGLAPAPQVVQLLRGLSDTSLPVLLTAGDTFSTAVSVSGMEGTLVPEDSRKIAAGLGLIDAAIALPELQQRLAVSRPARISPSLFEYEIIQRAKAERRHIVLPEGAEERILRAAEELLLRDVVAITLLGNEEEVRQKISSLGLRLNHVGIIDPLTSDRRAPFAETYFEMRRHKGLSRDMAFDAMADVSYFGTMMVYHGEADGMVSGAVHTTQHTIRPALEIIRTKPGCSIVSSVFLMLLADRVLVFGDCAVNPDPTAQQLADIAVSSAETAAMFGIEPLVAMLSYSTGASGKGEEVDKVREATLLARKLRPDLKIEGPLQYDAAVDPVVARTKLPESEVAGRATVLIFPDLNTGNNTYKAVQRSANVVAVGPVLQGLKKPVNDLSRGATVADIVNTVAITAIQARGSSCRC